MAAPPTAPAPPPAFGPQAGNTAMAPAPGATQQPTPPPTQLPMEPPTQAPAEPAPPPVQDGCALALDECTLNSGWPGDEFCIAPPPPDQGFQVHVGPRSYDNPEARYVVEPGDETNMYFDVVSGNDREIFYYYRQYRMRAGSHHLIVSSSGGGGGLGAGLGVGRRLGGSSNSAKDNPECGVIAPENEGVGMRLGPNTPLSVNLHYFNSTDGPVLQETWINFWYKDPAEVTDEASEIFSMGGLAMAIPPGAHEVLGPYSCSVPGGGRILTLYGHYHANTTRFTAWRVSGGQRELILEDYDWHDPLALEFSSLVENQPPNPATLVPGGHNGVLELLPGDRLEFECDVTNQTDGVLRFANEAVTGEMCILVGDLIGDGVSCTFP